MSEHYFGFIVRKARKNHACEFCFKPIRKNTKYHYHNYFEDGSFSHSKHHRLCTFMTSEVYNDYSGEGYDISHFSHPEERKVLIKKAKAAIKIYKSHNNLII